MCRRTYAAEAPANQCLETCLARWLGTSEPIKEVKDGSAGRFRCFFCKRVFASRTAAQACADSCRAKTEASVAAERAALGPPGAVAAAAAAVAKLAQHPAARGRKAPTTRRDSMHKFLRDGRKLVCRKCGAEHAKLDAVIACYDGHPVAEKKAPRLPKPLPVAKRPAPKAARAQTSPAATGPSKASERPAASEKAEASPAPVAKKAVVDDDHKFRRDGARYICRNCGAKFFTRADVVDCFDKH